MGYDTLENWFKVNWALMHHHKYNLTDIQNMIPWERMVYLTLVEQWVKEQNEINKDKG